MKDFRQRRQFKKIFFSRPVFGVLLAVLVLTGFSVFGMYKKSRQAVLRNRAVENALEEIRQRKQELEANISGLETELGVEQELRSKFQLKKPGEKYVVILNSESAGADSTTENKQGFFKKLIEFFNIF